MEHEAAAVAEVSTNEANDSIRAGYDRIANPNAQEETSHEETRAPTAETPPEPVVTSDQMKTLMAQVARIPELEKRLRDEGGRYGALKQSLEQLQQRNATQADSKPVDAVDLDDMLKDVKETFGEDDLYKSLKSAFAKVVASNRPIDQGTIDKLVAEKFEQSRQAEMVSATDYLTELHPTWMDDRETPEFHEWKAAMSERELKQFERSMDPDFVAGKLDDFQKWKSAKAAKASEPPAEPAAPPPPQPKTRLLNAVPPTNGTKPPPKGADNAKESIRAGYERIANARMR